MVPSLGDPVKAVGVVTAVVHPTALPVAPASPAAVDPKGLRALVGGSADPHRHSVLTALPPTHGELLWVLEAVPELATALAGPIPEEGLLERLQEIVAKQLDGLGRNWSPTGRSLMVTMREKFSDPARHSLLLSLIPDRSMRSRFLAGLLVIEEGTSRTFAEILSDWSRLLLTALPEDLDVSVYERRYRQLRGRLNELDRVEGFLFGQMNDLDAIALGKDEDVVMRKSGNEIVDKLAFWLALEDAGFELTRVVSEDKSGSTRVLAIGAARHNAMQQVTGLLTFLDVPGYLRGSSESRLIVGGKTLGAQWKMALHGFVFSDQVEKEEGEIRTWRGHVPDVVIRRYKKGKVPDGAKIQVQVTLQGNLEQLVFRNGVQVPSIASLMHQILRNLVSNSIKYCNLAEPKPKIEITIQALGLSAFIICKDNGLGGAKIDERAHEDEARGQAIGLGWVKRTMETVFHSPVVEEAFILTTSERVAPGAKGGWTTVLLLLPSEVFQS